MSIYIMMDTPRPDETDYGDGVFYYEEGETE